MKTPRAILLKHHQSVEPELDRLWTKAITPILHPKLAHAPRSNPRSMRPTLALAAAIVVLACIWVAVSHFGVNGRDAMAFAQTMDQIEKARTIQWKITFYNHATTKDGKRTWRTTETREQAYRAPGLYRDTSLDEKGQIQWVTIKDTVDNRELTLVPGKKRATLSEVAIQQQDPNGPFVWVNKELKDIGLQWVETHKTATSEVNVFRHAFKDNANGRDWSYDFWIDQKTKQLVELHVPGADIYDPDKDSTRNNPPGEMWMGTTLGGGFVEYDIVFDAHLDDSLFRLEPPADYAIETHARPHVTEKEMIDYLGILADFNDKTFPDQLSPVAITGDMIRKVWDKPEKDRTPAEQKLLNTDQHYIMAGLNLLPTGQFIQDNTEENSFRYLGKGAKLGDPDRIVCWYKLKGAHTYRVVYGDLSVKDITPEALPLPVEP